MAKSELLVAYEPSLPSIPIPICAESIILTSLAPSPIASVTFFGNLFLTIMTISAFCLGLALQAKTTTAESKTASKSSFKLLLLSINNSDCPETTIAKSRLSSVSC